MSDIVKFLSGKDDKKGNVALDRGQVLFGITQIGPNTYRGSIYLDYFDPTANQIYRVNMSGSGGLYAAGLKIKDKNNNSGSETTVAEVNGTAIIPLPNYIGEKYFYSDEILSLTHKDASGNQLAKNLAAGTSYFHGGGILMINPSTVNQEALIRILGSSGTVENTLELATRDLYTTSNDKAQIVARQYDKNNAILREAILLGTNGNTSFPGTVSAAGLTTTGDASIGGALNVTGNVTSPKFIGDLQGNADTATDATNSLNDGDGKKISTTYLKLAGGTMTGNISFAATTFNTSPTDSKGIVWSGGSDGAKIFYRQTANDAGSLVLQVSDDGEEYIQFIHTKAGVIYLKPNTKEFYPDTTNTGSLGTSSYRWGKVLVGTADSYGSDTQGIYWKNGVPTAMTYSLNANIQTGAAGALSYYSTTTQIDAFPNTVGSGIKLWYLATGVPTVSTSTVGGTAQPIYLSNGTITALTADKGSATQGVYLAKGIITPMTYSLNATLNSGTANRLAYYSEMNAISSGNKIWTNGTKLGINTTSEQSYNFYVNGTSYFNEKVWNPQGLMSFVQNNTIVGNTTDWDTLVTPGCYKVDIKIWGNAATYHSPNAVRPKLHPYGLLFVIKGSDTDSEARTLQVYFPHSSNSSHHVYCRMLNNETWTSWYPIYNGALDLDGGTMWGTINAMNIIPKNDNTYTLGTSTKRWKEIFGYIFTAYTKFQTGSSYLDSNNDLYIANSVGIRVTPDTNYALKVTDNSYFNGHLILADTKFIRRNGYDVSWIQGRDGAILRQTTYTGYNPIISSKTTDGDWSLGPYSNNIMYLTYCTDTNYNAGTNNITAQFLFKPTGVFQASYIGVNGDNAEYRFYVNGTSYFNSDVRHNGKIYLANGSTYFIDNSAQANLNIVTIGNGATGLNTEYKLYVNGNSWINGYLNNILFRGVTINNSTAFLSSGTSEIFGTTDDTNYKFTVLRMNGSAPNALRNGYASGIAWKGSDTYGMISVAYYVPNIKIAGGNGTNPVWWIGIDGTNGTTYNLNKVPDSDKLDGYHESSFLRYRDTVSGSGGTSHSDSLWSQIGIRQYSNVLPDAMTDNATYTYGAVISLPGANSRLDIWYNHQTSSNGNGLRYRTGWNDEKRAWATILDSLNYGTIADGRYVNVTGDTMTGDLTINATLFAGSKLKLWSDGEGGNIRLITPGNANNIFELDTCGNVLRLYYCTDGGTGATGFQSWTWGTDGSFTAKQFNGYLNGNAATATALTSSAGNTGQPVYFGSGKPIAIDWHIGNSGTGEHNCNNVTYNFCGYYTSNGPTTSSTTDGALYAQAYNSTWVGQIAQDYRNGGLYVRGKNNGTWQSWYTVLDTRNYAGTLDGRYVNVTGDTMTGNLTVPSIYVRGNLYVGNNNKVHFWEDNEGGNIQIIAPNGKEVQMDMYDSQTFRIYSWNDAGNYVGISMRRSDGHFFASAVHSAIWNDYAEYRESDTNEPGYVVYENGDDTLSKTTERLQHFAGIISDTFGFCEGETEKAKTPLAVAGRVLAYPYQDRNNYKPGDCVCAAPCGTVDIMTREEVIQYPDRIVGTVSCVPKYEVWGTGNVKVNGRIWIKVR